MWIEVEDEEGKIFVGLVYLAPGSFPLVREINEKLWDELSEDVMYFREKGRVCIIGDFNSRIGEMRSRCMSLKEEEEDEEEEKVRVWKRCSQDKKSDKAGKRLVQFMNDHELIILNGISDIALWTSIQIQGNSVIDYISSDESFQKKVKKFKTWHEQYLIVSDHRIITIEVEGELGKKVERKNSKEGKVEEKKKEGRGGRGWRRGEVGNEKFKQKSESEMSKWGKEHKEDEKDCEQVWRDWLDVHNGIAEETIGRTKGKKMRKWLKREYDQGLFEVVKEKNRLRKQMGKEVGERREEVVKEYKKVRQMVKRIVAAKKNRKQREMNEKLENFKGKNEKEYWRYLKNLAGIGKRDVELPDEVQLGDRVERGEKRKEIWNEAFSKLGRVDVNDRNFDSNEYHKIKDEVREWESKIGEIVNGELDGEIEEEELEKALKKVQNGKAAGDDECINEILKAGGDEMTNSLLILFQKMWREERVPKDWARGIIVPLYKDGERRNVDNYRGITLLSVVGKLHTSIFE